MATKGYHNILTYSDKQMKVTANVTLYRLTSKDLIEEPRVMTDSFDKPTVGTIYARQRSTGKRVRRGVIDKSTGLPLAHGYGHVWMNIDGEIVDKADIEYYQKTSSGEKKIRQYPANLGADRVLKPKSVIPLEEVDMYLVEHIYEVNGRDPEDDKTIYELGRYMEQKGFAIVYPFVVREGWKKYWAILVPNFHPKKKKFNLLAYMVRAKIEYQHWEDIPGKGVPTRKEAESLPTLDDDSPF